MVRIGVQAVPMTSMVAFSIGLTMVMQGAYQLSKFGASAYVPDLVSLTLLRELGPLLVGVVVIGRSGSAITAEIGTMKVSEEIEALQVMAINPIRFLIVPRFLAMLDVARPHGIRQLRRLRWRVEHLSFCAGYEYQRLHFAPGRSAHPIDLYAGIVKSFVFAWLIVTIASQAGLEVSGGAEGVGQSTTSSVVFSIIAMLIANAALTAVFFFAAPS